MCAGTAPVLTAELDVFSSPIKEWTVTRLNRDVPQLRIKPAPLPGGTAAPNFRTVGVVQSAAVAILAAQASGGDPLLCGTAQTLRRRSLAAGR